MTKSKTLADLIFGENHSDETVKLFFNDNITQKQANGVLKKIKHPEIVYVLDCLRNQINRKDEYVRYSSLGIDQKFDYFSVSIKNVFLFTDYSYTIGFVQKFYSLLDKAFPKYKTLENQPIGEILMNRR